MSDYEIHHQAPIEVRQSAQRQAPGEAILVCGPDNQINLPPNARVVNDSVDSSPLALAGLLDVVSVSDPRVAISVPSERDKPSDVVGEFRDVLRTYGLKGVRVPWKYVVGDTDHGFGRLFRANLARTLYVMTSDTRPYTCARFIVGETAVNGHETLTGPAIFSADFRKAARDEAIIETIADSAWKRTISGARFHDRIVRRQIRGLKVTPAELERLNNLPEWQKKLFFEDGDERDGVSYEWLKFAHQSGLLFTDLKGHRPVDDRVIGRAVANFEAEAESTD